MNDNSPFGFGRFVPGFDFLQSLAKGAASGVPGMPGVPGMGGLPGWVAPTANVQELDKRIQELKAVQFWLEQNARALAATVQALEVQKMTLATLAGMNVAVGDMAAAFGGAMGAAAAPAGAGSASAAPEQAAAEAAPAGAEAAQTGGAAMAMADPLQWWGALTSQFQQIAARAMQDAATQQAAFDATRDMASGALKTATDMATQWTQDAVQSAQAMTKPPRARRTAAAAPATAPTPQPEKPAVARTAARKSGKK